MSRDDLFFKVRVSGKSVAPYWPISFAASLCWLITEIGTRGPFKGRAKGAHKRVALMIRFVQLSVCWAVSYRCTRAV